MTTSDKTSSQPAATSRCRVFLRCFGCQMNKLDSELVLSVLTEAGYAMAESIDDADVILFNTCSVRAHAEERVYSHLGTLKAAKRRRPELVIGVIGCMAQKEGRNLLQRAPHVDLVCGTRMFPRVAELLADVRRGRGPVVAVQEAVITSVKRSAGVRPRRAQAFVSVMRGCDNYCAYCVVPYVRGREISRPVAEIVAEVRQLVADGCIEVTLLGQNVNSYGKSLSNGARLPNLLEELDAIPGLARIHFVTSNPKDMSRDILEAVGALPKVCEYLHMPAQAGSDRVLKLMRRGYTNGHYRDLAALARELIPGVAIASDFIVGFPSETADEFDKTAQLVRDMRFQNSFIFKYSPRPGTAAAKLADDVRPEEKRRRNQALLGIQQQVSEAANAEFLGREVEVLVEGSSRSDPARLTGRLRTNHIVVFPGGPGLVGRLVTVRIHHSTALTLYGDFVGDGVVACPGEATGGPRRRDQASA